MLELDRESPLFDAVLGVRVCSDGGREEGERLLTVRLLSGSRVAANTVVLPTDADPNAKHRGRERLLHLELCDGQDPYFLYSLDVGEGDFHELRREHGLLVDFGSFPRHFIELLGRCTGEPQDDWAGARFGAALGYCVITNDFIEEMVFVYPELLLIVLAIVILLGRYNGFKLTEYRRFRKLAATAS